jgi:long-chain fatty acid transport protein
MRNGATGAGAGLKSALMATTAVAALLATSNAASAGGFYIREQSAEFQGMSFAGDAAGTAISSMFWNSAATANRDGLNTESSYTVISADSKVTVTNYDTTGISDFVPAQQLADYLFSTVPAGSGDIGPPAFVGATYGSYQLSKNVFIGMAVNAPFGLKTDPENYNYQGSVIAQKTELRTYNFNPTVAIRIAPGISVGVGAQIQTAEGAFRFASGTPVHDDNLGAASGFTSKVEGNGWGFGGTAGIMIDATPTTRIGVGYRSQIDQDIDGHISTDGFPALSQDTEVTLKLPDVVTFSIRQVVSPVMRLNGTFEWTNWSRFKDLTVIAAETGINVLHNPTTPTPDKNSPAGSEIASIPQNWSDGYFLSGGVEYDIYPTLTGRAGVAYEWSPVDAPEKRSTGFPDANRVWLSGGFSWAFTPTTTIDFGYTHVFVEDSDFSRESLSNVLVEGDVETKIDIVSVGIKTKW